MPAVPPPSGPALRARQPRAPQAAGVAGDGQTRKGYHCAICGKGFNYHGSLLKHRSVHRGTSRCPICNQVFNRTSYIKPHLMTVHGVPLHQLSLYYPPAARAAAALLPRAQ